MTVAVNIDGTWKLKVNEDGEYIFLDKEGHRQWDYIPVSAEDLSAFFDEITIVPYSYIKIGKDAYSFLMHFDDSDAYIIHMNENARGDADLTVNGKYISIRLDVALANEGYFDAQMIFGSGSDAFPGEKTDCDIYALFIGGNKDCFQLVILGVE